MLPVCDSVWTAGALEDADLGLSPHLPLSGLMTQVLSEVQFNNNSYLKGSFWELNGTYEEATQRQAQQLMDLDTHSPSPARCLRGSPFLPYLPPTFFLFFKKLWQNIYWRRNGNPLQCSCIRNLMYISVVNLHFNDFKMYNSVA